MKNALTILMIILFANFSDAQTNSYSSLWKKVEKFENDGLPKSALDVVEQIKSLAKKEQNTPQHIKSLLYKSKYALTLEEDAQLHIINDFKAEISQSEAPTKNVLENMLANMYWQYFQQNRYQFYNRTKTNSKVDAEDFRTWDLKTLFEEIHIYYQRSLENGLILQQTQLKAFKDIISEQNGSKQYRPTLFDLLNHNALEFYKTDEHSITQPAYKFEIDHSKFIGSADAFSKLRLKSVDTASLQLHALKLYQNLIQFHLKDKDPFALVDVDLERLKFVYNNATFSDKDMLFLNSLKTSSSHYSSHKVSALYNFEIAQIYYQQGQGFHPKTNPDVRWKTKDALELCKSTIFAFPKSKGAEKCKALKSQIELNTLQMTTEEFVPINDYSRVLVNYKNIDRLNFKLFKVSLSQLDSYHYLNRPDEKLAYIKTLSLFKEWESQLKNENDFQQHTTEIVIPQLANGHYLLYAEANNIHKTFGTTAIQSTNLSLVEKSSDHEIKYQIINRTNGKPIVGALATLTYQNKYNSNFLSTDLVSDTNGHISMTKTKSQYINLKIEVSRNDDKAHFGNYRFYNRNRKDLDKNLSYKTFLFTDRSIYRPGQTVYFKGIAMTTENGKSTVYANKGSKIRLKNVNGELVKEYMLKTNEFGSVAGEFILPNDGLTGQYTIDFFAGVYAYAHISVEDYKRPKFETTFNPVTETFKVNDSVTVKGNALAYAGSSITDAKVVYRVKRNVQYPTWYYWYRPWFNSEPQEITHGEALTDDKGDFEITFKAIPDESVDKSSLPVFHYEITADVTDLNGETRSATTIVNVGYHALIANLSVDSKLDKTKKDHQLTINTKNLNGEFIPAKGAIKIYKLKAPKKVLRPRLWNAPDYQVIPENEFNSMFPYEAYANEHNPNTWEKGELVLDTTFDTETSKTLGLGTIKRWTSGQYVILLESKDKFGQLVKDEIKTSLYSDDDNTLADHQLFSITTDKNRYSVNDKVLVTLGSAAENVTVTLEVEKNHKIINTYIIPLSNNKKTIAIPVNKEDVGGFAVHYSFAVYNTFQGSALHIAVPYPKTDLNIETLTFRDKLQPGTDETWSFKIKGPKGDKVSAELLASMYDASLDQFKPHSWNFNPIQQALYNTYSRRNAGQSFGIQNFRVYNQNHSYYGYDQQYYDQLNWFGFYFGYGNRYHYRAKSGGIEIVENMIAEPMMLEDDSEMEYEEVVVESKSSGPLNLVGGSANEKDNVENTKKEENFDTVQIRKNLQETAFFFPQLLTDAEGNVSFNFTTPEALTKWKLQLLAHTKTLEHGVTQLETVTQKELMVIPNAPRFLREGDQITISTKIANLTENQLSGQARLILTNPISGQDISEYLLSQRNMNYDAVPSHITKAFSVDAKGNTQVSWQLSIPSDVQAVQYKILAKSGDFSDGEQNALPVLSNRMLVTETLPMWIKSNETRTFTLDKLKTNTSTTLKHHKLTLEMTSNPAWYAVQALPYLMEYPYDCNEQTFSRYYANALASHIANSNPRIQEVFNQWASQDALISNLEKNEELKSILIQETPWLRDAQSETEQKKRIALLFDLNKMNNELQSAKRKLENNQMDNGAWPWFNGGRPNRYITQHIITGFGHLKHLNVTTDEESQMIRKAIQYLDSEFVQEYKDLKKYNSKVDLAKDHLSYTQLHYLYMRSFFSEIEASKEVKKITTYYHSQIKKYWLPRSLYAKGLMALVVDRMDDKTTSTKILKSLKETSITNEELGMYWKANTSSWYWYQAPIETQALLIEAFAEIENDTETIDNLKIWLLKHKQTNQWKTTKATTEAVYALLLQGSDWLSITEMVDVVLGGQAIDPSKLEDTKVEAGTGYFKTAWNASEIKLEMAEVKLSKKGNGIAWGSLYWQYFEDLDQITSAETPLKLKKKLFLKTNTDTGEEISEITSETKLNVGDLVRVRIELRSDRAMEFVHMKDMRASGLEPINVLSRYKWQDGLGYYESTKDASTNFFFDYLPKGVFVFEYDLRVNNAGDMSNGITTIQSMYAPEFSSHSEGIRIKVN